MCHRDTDTDVSFIHRGPSASQITRKKTRKRSHTAKWLSEVLKIHLGLLPRLRTSLFRWRLFCYPFALKPGAEVLNISSGMLDAAGRRMQPGWPTHGFLSEPGRGKGTEAVLKPSCPSCPAHSSLTAQARDTALVLEHAVPWTLPSLCLESFVASGRQGIAWCRQSPAHLHQAWASGSAQAAC